MTHWRQTHPPSAPHQLMAPLEWQCHHRPSHRTGQGPCVQDVSSTLLTQGRSIFSRDHRMAVHSLGTETSLTHNCYKPPFYKLFHFQRPKVHPKLDHGKKLPHVLCNRDGNSHITWFTEGKTSNFLSTGEGSDPLVLLLFRAKLEYWP